MSYLNRYALTEVVRRSLLPVLVCVLSVMLGEVLLSHLLQREVQETRSRTEDRLATLRARLEGAIGNNLQLMQGMVSNLALEPEMDQARFAALAQELLENPNQFKALAAARDLVVTRMYPLAGNERALGLDYRSTASQRGPALRARDTGRLVLAGPLNLVQGGTGLVARAPVFLARGEATLAPSRFWGLVAAVIDVDALIAHVGLYENALLDLRVGLRGTDGKGALGAVFHGDGHLFEEDSVRVMVSLPDGEWQLAGKPANGWPAASAVRWEVRAASITLGVLLAALLWLHGRQRTERELARLHLNASRSHLADAIESLRDGFCLWDADDRLALANSRLAQFTGGAPMTPGTPYASMISALEAHGAGGGAGRAWVEDVLARHAAGEATLECELADGRWVHLVEQGTSDGGTVCLLSDVTEQREAEQHVRQRANYDLLTGLFNRARFMEELDTTLHRCKRTGRRVALLFIDLDRFKNVNDTLGHNIGDRLLEEAARRLLSCVRETDTVARLGGDEFTVILDGLTGEDAASRVAYSIISRLSEPYDLEGYEIHAGASIGVTVCPDDAADADTLLRNADLAMYRAKESGRNRFCYFTAELTGRAEHAMAIERDLRRALVRDELHMVYQPIVSLDGEELRGVEALMRWSHPERGNVPPGEFIPVAEDCGLIAELGEWALRLACSELAALGERAASTTLSVNVSARQFLAGFGGETVTAILSETGFPAERLVVEITESTLIGEDGRVRDSLRDLRQMGVGIALDDFGTGYSSLSYLRHFPVTQIKIDRSFVRDLEIDEGDARLVETIIAMAGALELSIVAEGVETARQRDLLQDIGCDMAQGYHLGRPGPLEAIWPAIDERLEVARSVR